MLFLVLQGKNKVWYRLRDMYAEGIIVLCPQADNDVDLKVK